MKKPIWSTVTAGSGTIGSSAAGLWVANVSYRVNSELDVNLLDGRHIVVRPTLLDVRVKNADKTWMSRTGAYGAYLENIEVLDSPHVLFGGAFSHSIIRGVRGVYYTRAVELKTLTHDTIISDLDLTYSPRVSDKFDSPEVPISFGELSRNLRVVDGTLNMGDSSGMGQIVQNVGCWDCGIERFHFRGNPTLSNVLTAGGGNTRGFFRNNTVEIGGVTGNAFSFTDAVDFDLSRNRIFGTNGGIASLQTGMDGGRIVDNWFENEEEITLASGILNKPQVHNNHGVTRLTDEDYWPDVRAHGNGGDTWDSITSAVYSERTGAGTAYNSTSEEVYGSVPVIPAGTLDVGDRIRLRYNGTVSGSNDTRTLKFTVAIDVDDDGVSMDGGDDQNVILNRTMPSTADNWELVVEIVIQSATTFTASAKLTELETAGSSNVVGDVIRVTGADFANHAMRLELTGLVANASDSNTPREYQREVTRFGMA